MHDGYSVFVVNGETWYRFRIRRNRFGQFANLKNEFRNRVVHLREEFLARLPLLRHVWQAQAVEQNLAHLLRRVRIKAWEVALNLSQLRINLAPQSRSELCIVFAVDGDAFHLHIHDHFDKRQFHILHQFVNARKVLTHFLLLILSENVVLDCVHAAVDTHDSGVVFRELLLE